MGYFGNLEGKLLAQKLRRKGLSYGEILQKVYVSKDTISRWCKDIELTDKQKNRLINNKIFGQKKGSLIAAENKRKKRIETTNKIYSEAAAELGGLSKRDRFVVGLALYAGEGDKTGEGVGFANSDPLLIKFMMLWFREYLFVPEEKFRGAIWLHEGLNESKAKEYWSNITKIPTSQFHKTYIAINKTNSKKIRKNIHNFGVISIRFSDVNKLRRILGWISALFGDKL
jgi:hypothetical protein